MAKPEVSLTGAACFSCQKIGPTRACSICHCVCYCSVEVSTPFLSIKCQKYSWKSEGHKRQCMLLAEISLKNDISNESPYMKQQLRNIPRDVDGRREFLKTWNLLSCQPFCVTCKGRRGQMVKGTEEKIILSPCSGIYLFVLYLKIAIGVGAVRIVLSLKRIIRKRRVDSLPRILV
jgi:hypothetical protein